MIWVYKENNNTAILFAQHAIMLSTPYNISTCFIIISILEKNKKQLCHRQSQCIISIGGWGKTVRDRLAPTLGGHLTPHAHYLKEGGIWDMEEH